MNMTVRFWKELGTSMLLLVAAVQALKAMPTNATYKATWASVDAHNPAPEWFQDAKFGIYFHWGIFSVPAHYNEWYPRWSQWSNDTTGCYTCQTSSNLAMPASNWTRLLTNQFDESGNFNFTNPPAASPPPSFYRLQLQ
jgi:alpha-L-fucosidase